MQNNKNIFFITLLSAFFSVTFSVYGQSYLTNLNEQLIKNIQAEDNFGNLIKNFCTKIKKSNIQANNLSNYPINPKKSIYLNLICEQKNIKLNPDFPQIEKKNFNSTMYILQNCNSNYGQKDPSWGFCNNFKIINKNYYKIVKEIFDIKQANNYGLIGEKTNGDELAKNFLKENFYISEENEISKPSYFPKTIMLLKSYITKAKSMISDTKIIDTKNFEEIQNKEFIKKGFCEKYRKYIVTSKNKDELKSHLPQDLQNEINSTKIDLYYFCGLYSQDFNIFKNFVLNELFAYGLLNKYVETILQTNSNFDFDNKSQDLKYQKKLEYNQKIAKDLNFQYITYKNTTFEALTNLFVMKQAFLFHIGLNLYIEVLEQFRKELASLMKPIYIFGETFKNRQTDD